MGLLEYALLVLSSLFVVVDPVSAVPAFLAMTTTDTVRQKIRMAGLACSVAGLVLFACAALGELVFAMLGITLAAFQIAAGIVLLLISLDMLRTRRSAVQETPEETEAGTRKEDIAITPLAVPLLAGPGAVSVAVVLRGQAPSLAHQITLYAGIALVCLASFVTFCIAARAGRWIGPLPMKILTRIMGLFLAAFAVQMMLNALPDVLPHLSGFDQPVSPTSQTRPRID